MTHYKQPAYINKEELRASIKHVTSLREDIFRSLRERYLARTFLFCQ